MTHASISRSSQPLVGASRKRSKEDEDYLNAIFKVDTNIVVCDIVSCVGEYNLYCLQANKHGKKLYVMDARPRINALANIVSYSNTAACI